MKFENKNQKGELKMENENQKLSFVEILRTINEICNSTQDCVSSCPFMKNDICIVERLSLVKSNADEIEAICTEWEMNKPTLADKINEILKPYGMKLMDGNHYIWFNDGNMEFHTSEFHTKDELINKLYTTKWKGKPNE
jgi:hypothetical protein